MAVYKQLKTKIDGVTTEIYPYTSPDAVLNSDGTTLQDTLDNLSGGTDIDLSSKADVDSPVLTGTPQAPTATAGTNTDQIATTAFVQNAINNIETSGDTPVMSGASSDSNGSSGLVPAPTSGQQNHFLRGDGTWAEVDTEITKQDVIDALGYEPGTGSGEPDGNTTYTLTKSGSTITLTGSDGSTTSVEDSDTVSSITDTNTTYTLTKSGSTITLTGSDGSTTSVEDDNTDTTYSDATTTTSGLMSSTDKTKLDAVPNSVITNTDPGVGTSSSYPDNTLIFVYEE